MLEKKRDAKTKLEQQIKNDRLSQIREEVVEVSVFI